MTRNLILEFLNGVENVGKYLYIFKLNKLHTSELPNHPSYVYFKIDVTCVPTFENHQIISWSQSQ